MINRRNTFLSLEYLQKEKPQNSLPSQLQESQAPSLGGEDPLEKEMATHSSFLTWEISWTEEPGGLQPIRLQRVRHD